MTDTCRVALDFQCIQKSTASHCVQTLDQETTVQ